ncbi:DNA polymerase III subunit gamma and tau [Streptomyces sp. NPDC005438]|uniref:DNA polymerase III subunit gamma and tau n=1 Tax=Streptomyces sp. NPDC005438 TaxID=3156880 RepID=UPI0033B3678D
MSSLALYRRYRPETFAEVIGQEHVTDPLQQALRNNRVNHAYLFSGPRGCGKTTSARILARCLNCEQGPTPSPCGECMSCTDLARNGPGSLDVIEIDAASHGGVDDARELREKAFFGPASSRYKIYIIDEAHMVTSAGFNALLKVVEEPPEHLKFIFATTEPEKVIGTIRSRTHHYPFRLVPPGTLRDYLREVCERESVTVDDAVLPLVVRAGAGSVRDSMSVMDQLLAGADEGGVSYAMATSLLGYTDGALLDAVVDAFAAGDGAAAFEVVDQVIEGGHDPRRFVIDLLERLRDLVILAAVPEAREKGLIDAPADVVEGMQRQATAMGPAELSRAADLVNQGLTEMRGATSPRLQLELICARVLLPAAYGDERAVQARLDRLERGVAGQAASFAGAQGAPPASAPPPAAVPTGGPPPSADPATAPQESVPPGGGPAAARAALAGGARGGAPAQPSEAYPPEAQPERGDPVPPPEESAAEPGPPPYDSGPEPAQPEAGGAPPQSVPGGAPPSGGAGPAQEGATSGQGRRPGAWPGAAPPGGPPATGEGASGAGSAEGSTGAPARRPGAWPGSRGETTGGGARPSEGAPHAPQTEPRPPSAQPAPATPPPATQPAGTVRQGDAHQVRQMWPRILDAVKGRRRFSWILLSQNAQVVGFDGTTLQLGFSTVGARDSFVNSGSDDVLKEALSSSLQVQWQVEAIVDPGSGPPPGGGGAPTAPSPSSGFGGAAPPPARSEPSTQSGGGEPSPERGSGGSAAARQALATAQAAGPSVPEARQQTEPAPTPWEDDQPAEDDPDLEDSALAGHELIIRELGGTVIEEFHHE